MALAEWIARQAEVERVPSLRRPAEIREHPLATLERVDSMTIRRPDEPIP